MIIKTVMNRNNGSSSIGYDLSIVYTTIMKEQKVKKVCKRCEFKKRRDAVEKKRKEALVLLQENSVV